MTKTLARRRQRASKATGGRGGAPSTTAPFADTSSDAVERAEGHLVERHAQRDECWRRWTRELQCEDDAWRLGKFTIRDLYLFSISPLEEHQAVWASAMKLRETLPPRVFVELLLSLLSGSAVDAQENGLARLCWALYLAFVGRDVAWLEGKGGPLAHAEQFLERRFPNEPHLRNKYSTRSRARRVMLRELACCFREPVRENGTRIPLRIDEGLLLRVGIELRNHRAELFFGEPRPTWRAFENRLVEQLRRVSMRSARSQRSPMHYVAATLRAWGLSPAQARDLTKRMEDDE